MRRIFQRRASAKLSDSLHRQLDMYVLAASAAGVGVVALAQSANAEIVYTSANETIGPITYLDLNHDGVNDFKFTTSHVNGACYSGSTARLAVYGIGSKDKISGESVFASALPPGAYIGPAGKFNGQKMGLVAYACSSGQGGGSFYGRNGFWAGPAGGGIEHRYLGLRFRVNDEVHFGWARIDVVVPRPLSFQATLTGYAYETIPNQRVIAGKLKETDVVGVA